MKVSIIVALTLDGRIAERADQTSLEWTSKEDKRFFVSKTKESGVMIMGRTTFVTIGRPLPGRKMIVMTRQDRVSDAIEGSLEFTDQEPEEILKALEKEGREEVMICGGAQIYSLFLEKGLVTDLYVTLEPIILGDGISFVENISPKKFTLHSSESLGSDALMLHYRI